MMQPNIFYRHFDLPRHFPVIGLLGSKWLSASGPVTRQHFHNCLEIGVLFEGEGELYMDDQRFPYEAPCLLILPPRLPHANRALEGSLCRWNWLYLDPQALLPHLPPASLEQIARWQQGLSGSACILPGDAFPRENALIRMIIGQMEEAEPGYRQIAAHLFGALLLMLARHTPHQTPPSQIRQHLGTIEPAVRFISAHYMENLTADLLAGLCHLSASHFRRLFRQILGHSPLDYLHMVRIDHACALLYNHRHSVASIGRQVGYATPSSFLRQFRRIHGVSPNQWRMRLRSEENPMVSAYFESLPPEISRFFPPDAPAD